MADIDLKVADAIDPPNSSPVTIASLQAMIGAWAKRKGWTATHEETPTKLMLMVSELSEALEEFRKGLSADVVYYHEDGNGMMKPEGIGMELADCVIRILHYADDAGIDMGELILEKMAYNEKRPHRHGNKVV